MSKNDESKKSKKPNKAETLAQMKKANEDLRASLEDQCAGLTQHVQHFRTYYERLPGIEEVVVEMLMAAFMLGLHEAWHQITGHQCECELWIGDRNGNR